MSGLQGLDDLVLRLETKLCQPEQYIIHKHDESNYLYFINSGKAEIFLFNPVYGKLDKNYFEAVPSNILGEIGVILDVKRSAYVLA